MARKYNNIFHSNVLQNIPKFGLKNKPSGNPDSEWGKNHFGKWRFRFRRRGFTFGKTKAVLLSLMKVYYLESWRNFSPLLSLPFNSSRADMTVVAYLSDIRSGFFVKHLRLCRGLFTRTVIFVSRDTARQATLRWVYLAWHKNHCSRKQTLRNSHATSKPQNFKNLAKT
jgi:hypothetical protein